MTEPDIVEAETTKIIGNLPSELDVDRDTITGAIDKKLKTYSENDHLKAVKFGSGGAIEIADGGLEFLASASVEPRPDTSSEGPPMRARVLNVIVTVRQGNVEVRLPFYADR